MPSFYVILNVNKCWLTYQSVVLIQTFFLCYWRYGVLTIKYKAELTIVRILTLKAMVFYLV